MWNSNNSRESRQFGLLAQSVEQLAVNQEVIGSNPIQSVSVSLR